MSESPVHPAPDEPSLRMTSHDGARPHAASVDSVERHVEHVRTLLAKLIELSGLSRRQVEQTLLEKGHGTDLGRLLSGRLDLKLSHILAICEVIEISPEELFRIAYRGRGPRSPLVRRLSDLLALDPSRTAASESMGQSDAATHQMLRQLDAIQRRLDDVVALLAPDAQSRAENIADLREWLGPAAGSPRPERRGQPPALSRRGKAL